MLCLIACALIVQPDPPTVRVTADDTKIDRSCIIEIPPGLVIPDANGDGVIHIAADRVTIRFAPGSTLRGAAPATPWDTLSGIGVRIDKHTDVTLQDLRVHGYKIGVSASSAHGLRVESADLSDNFRQRLKSTPTAEDASDWLYPHHNDDDQWAKNYGAALFVKESKNIDISRIKVRRGQNGIILSRVTDSLIYDNDCSFLSGWGLAMWRSSRNSVTQNAFDFCVRGHVEGVYNRGQDSAGILMFEQCCDNTIADNSVTHGGDGFFGFAGVEALGEKPANPPLDPKRRGCNDNRLVENDFSYAAAHGIELTFSFGNKILNNRIVENAICGVWGGYSQDFLIAGNTFERNGGMAYGLERGGINIEHGSGNSIISNTFTNNRAAVHLWWDDDKELLAKPWAKTNHRGVTSNIIASNTITINDQHPFGRNQKLIGLHLRDAGKGNLSGNRYDANTVSIAPDIGQEILADPTIMPVTSGAPLTAQPKPDIPTIGATRPVGARAALRGRDKIIMDQWGPWDHRSPMVRLGASDAGSARFEVFGVLGAAGSRGADGKYNASFPAADNTQLDITIDIPRQVQVKLEGGDPRALILSAPAGVWPYAVTVTRPDRTIDRFTGSITAMNWSVTAFAWTDATDPRKDLAAWRALAQGPDAVTTTRNAIAFPFNSRGPKHMKWSDEMTARGPAGDRFAIIATTTVPLPPGRWRATVTSDDGVRLLADSKPVLENWTWHAPTKDTGEFTAGDSPTTLTIEYFEIDGHAVLKLDLERIN